MTTQDVIAKVEAIGQAFSNAMQEHGVTGISTASAGLDNLPLPVFIEVCEHYGVQPSNGTWPSTWIKSNGVSLYVQCERIGAVAEKVDTLSKLRELVPTANAA